MKLYEIFEKTYTDTGGQKFNSLGLYHTEEGAKRALEYAVYSNLYKCDSIKEVEKDLNTLARFWRCYCSPRTGISIRIRETKD